MTRQIQAPTTVRVFDNLSMDNAEFLTNVQRDGHDATIYQPNVGGSMYFKYGDDGPVVRFPLRELAATGALAAIEAGELEAPDE